MRGAPSGTALTILALVCHFVCPLLFFTDLTRNPYFTQIALMNMALLGAVAAYALGQAAGSDWRLPRSALDVPLACWIGVCVFTWIWAYCRHVPFYRDAIFAEGLRVMAFTVINTLVPYYLGLLCAQGAADQPETAPGRWALFALVWIGLWALYPEMRRQAPWSLQVLPHLWDYYGGFLWIAGCLGIAWLARGATAHHFWHAALSVGFIGALYGVSQYFNREWIWPKVLNPYGGRAVSTFGNPNFMSSYMVMLLPVSLAYYFKARTLAARFSYAAAFLAMEACLLASLTRSSWAGALVAVGFLAFSKELRRRMREGLELHGVLVSAAVLMVLLWPQSTVHGYTPSVLGRIRELAAVTRLDSGSPYTPLYQRVLIWSCAWMMGNENPLWGKGWGLFELFYPFYQGHMLGQFDFFQTMRTHANNTHNEILEVWSQTGLLGLGVLCWTWATFFACVRRWGAAAPAAGASPARPGKDAPESGEVWRVAAAAGVAGMLADNLLNVSLHFAVPAFLFWWQAGIAMGLPARFLAPTSFRTRLRFPGRRFSAAAAAAVLALSACGGWWWTRQWGREVRYFLGFKLLRGQRMAAAIEQLEAAHRWHSREVNTNYELGNAYARSDLFDKAAWAYREALRANAGYDEIYFNLGTVLAQRLGRREEGLRHYLTSYAINPLSQELYTHLSAYYLGDPGRYRDDAAALLERAVHYFPENPNFLYNLGYLRYQAGDMSRARDLLSGALMANPEFQAAENALRGMQARGGGAAIPVLKELDAYRALETRVTMRKDYSVAALESARRAVQAFPRSAKARFYLGNLEVLHGDVGAALKQLEPLVRADPRNVPLLRNLGEIYLRIGRGGEAAAAFRAILAVEPRNAFALEKLAQLGASP